MARPTTARQLGLRGNERDQPSRRATSTRRQHGRPLKAAEVRGFVGSVAAVVFFCVYMVWAYVPDPVLQQLGLTYYPSKEWAVTVPMFVVMSVAMALTAYSAVNHMAVQPPGSVYAIRDEFSLPYKERGPSSSHSPTAKRPQRPKPPQSATADHADADAFVGSPQGEGEGCGWRTATAANGTPMPSMCDLPITLVNDLLYPVQSE